MRVKFGGSLAGKAAGRRTGMDACGEKRLVCIDISDSTQKCLVQEQRLDRTIPFPETSVEGFGFDQQRVGPGLGYIGRNLGKELHAAKLPDIVVDEDSAIQFEDGPGVFARSRIPEQIAGHPEMNIEEAAVEVYQDLLAVTANRENAGAGERAGRSVAIAARDAMRGERYCANLLAQKEGRDRANDGFDLR